MKDNRWVPGWMCAPRPQTDTTERTDNWLMPPDEQPHRPAGDRAAARDTVMKTELTLNVLQTMSAQEYEDIPCCGKRYAP